MANPQAMRVTPLTAVPVFFDMYTWVTSANERRSDARKRVKIVWLTCGSVSRSRGISQRSSGRSAVARRLSQLNPSLFHTFCNE